MNTNQAYRKGWHDALDMIRYINSPITVASLEKTVELALHKRDIEDMLLYKPPVANRKRD